MLRGATLPSDAGVKTVFDLARDARLRHIGIVCTKSDDINPEEIKNDLGEEAGRKIRKLMELLCSLERELKDVDEELATFQNLPKDYELKKYAIELRNAYVVGRLKETYQDYATAETLHIFCVSNKMYWERRMDENSVSEPFLNLSGIIEFRKHCIAMVAASQLRTSSSFLAHDVPTLLSEIELWVQSGSGSTSAEQKEAVRGVLDRVERQLRKVR
ncbi:putative tat pathway signal sequence [Diaporthe ampelina]|uniref:Putative tat pathway signal sequence n=1 Tax=Diaporthe ampelina TaxID=1214573 RepID=A0A0G2FR49_9PEZI|nr:putative tat pathway signal sequence [Diaporthe ampelina]